MPDEPQQQVTTNVICSVCNRQFQNHQALRSHFASHPIESNNARLRDHHAAAQHTDDTREAEAADDDSTLRDECTQWLHKFNAIANNLDSFDFAHFDQLYSEFATFLFTSNKRLPGPKHPASKFYLKRRQKRAAPTGAQQSKSSNPQRTSARVRERRRAQYMKDLCQYWFYNQRKKAWTMIKNPKGQKNVCNIPMADLEEYFRQTLEKPNDNTLDYYQPGEPRENISITIEQVDRAIKSVNLDTSPGPDRILIRTIRDLKVSNIIKVITEIMLSTNTVPTGLSEGKTVLIHKGGDPTRIGNWRPITIYSVVRRIIERVLDGELRSQLNLNINQRGFITRTPGCHINSALVNTCLRDAKQKKSDCTVVFLDLSKAFDRIGHEHIKRCLLAHGVSRNLSQLVMSLLCNNTVRISLGKDSSAPIRIRRSVPQGGPLSPILFNLAIDFIYREVCDPQFAEQSGYKLKEGFEALSLTGFADDQAVTSNTLEGARRIVELTQSLFQQIGLEVNPTKSSAINIKHGELVPGTLQLSDQQTIECINKDDRIKYLGCSFTSELVFDRTIVGKITESINNLIESPLVHRDQKLNLLNQYVLPMLVYPLQSAPRRKIPQEDLVTLDRTIRTAVKAIIGLPTSTSTDMIYSPRKYRGLGVMRCEWEVILQHYSIAKKLSAVPDALFQEVYNCEEEMKQCVQALAVEGQTARKLRTALREKAFENWCSLDYQGIGVKHFRTCPKANRFTSDKNTLSTSEWVGAIKLSTNYANLVGVPGVNEQSQDRRCRRCRSETQSREIPSHVLGFCKFGDKRRNDRHHRIKHQIRQLMRNKGFHCEDEVSCVDGEGRNRRIDILAFEPHTDRAFIIDPTIRYETNRDMDGEVQAEKHGIYASCIPDIAKKYEHFGRRVFEVIGLWFGARGTVSTGVLNFFDRFSLPKNILPEMTETILADSVRMINHHIYASNDCATH